MKGMKRRLGWGLFILGMLFLAAFIIALTVHRFRNDHLTETQLMIWCLKQWWYWVPATLLSAIGFSFINPE